jgi:hypothetical protein
LLVDPNPTGKKLALLTRDDLNKFLKDEATGGLHRAEFIDQLITTSGRRECGMEYDELSVPELWGAIQELTKGSTSDPNPVELRGQSVEQLLKTMRAYLLQPDTPIPPGESEDDDDPDYADLD